MQLIENNCVEEEIFFCIDVLIDWMAPINFEKDICILDTKYIFDQLIDVLGSIFTSRKGKKDRKIQFGLLL